MIIVPGKCCCVLKNQPLSKLDDHQAQRLQKAIEALVGKRENEFLVPRLLTKLSDSKGQTRYILIEESPLLFIPGNSGLRVHVFTLDGSLIRSSGFHTGWRIEITDVRVAYMAQIGRQALEVKSEPVINGGDVAKQFYALVNDDVLLIRLEDKDGHLVRNVYGAPNVTCGFTITDRSVDEWENALKSSDTAEVLATLSWLSGTHWDPRQPAPEYQHEEISEAQIAAAACSSQGVKATLKTLQLSEKPWVREAASLATTTEYYFPGIRIG